jgi:hypothetical protein
MDTASIQYHLWTAGPCKLLGLRPTAAAPRRDIYEQPEAGIFLE